MSDIEEIAVNALWQYSSQKYFYFKRNTDGSCGDAWRSNQSASAIYYIGGPDDGKKTWFAEEPSR